MKIRHECEDIAFGLGNIFAPRSTRTIEGLAGFPYEVLVTGGSECSENSSLENENFPETFKCPEAFKH